MSWNLFEGAPTSVGKSGGRATDSAGGGRPSGKVLGDVMRAVIVSDAHPVGSRLRATLLNQGADCPASHVVSLDLAHEVVNRPETAADVIFVVLSPSPEDALVRLQALRAITRAKLVTVGSSEDPQQILNCIHAHADDYLADDDLATGVPLLLERIKRDLWPERASGRLISVVGVGGGSGATTIATNLAVAVALQQGQCGLYDMHFQGGDLATLLDLKPLHTIVDLCRNRGTLDAAMFEQSLAQHSSGVRLLAAPDSLQDVQLMTPEALTHVLQLARAAFQASVVDLEDVMHGEQAWIVEQSDTVLVVLRLDIVALAHARRTVARLESLGVTGHRVQLVANRFGRPKDLTISSAERATGLKITHCIPDDQAAVNASVNVGNPVVLEYPKSKVAKSFESLAGCLNSSKSAPREVMVHA